MRGILSTLDTICLCIRIPENITTVVSTRLRELAPRPEGALDAGTSNLVLAI